MATMRRDPGRARFPLVLMGCLAALGAAQAQTQTHSVTPTLGLRIEHTDNVDGVSNTNLAGKHSENIVTISPALELQHRGPNTVLEGRFGLVAEHRVQGTASDRVVPDGRLRLRTEPGGHGAGLEASLQAQQVKPVVSSSGGTSTATANTVTETQASVAPFFERRVGERHDLIARAQGLQARTDPRLDTSRETRTNSFNAQVGLIRRPSPFGYALEASALRENQKSETPSGGTRVPTLREDGRTDQSSIRATLLYAFGQEFESGLILGSEDDRRRVVTSGASTNNRIERKFDGEFWGLQATWRPGPRTEINGTYEDRKAARTWSIDASHRLRRTTLSLTDRQVATRNAPSSVTQASDTASQTVTATPGATLPLSNQATTLISIQRNTGLRVTYAGVRTTLSLIAGQFRARALLATGNSTGADRSRYHGAEISYRLASQLTPNMGMRWSHAKDAAGLSRKEQLISMGLRIRLSQSSSFDAGWSRLKSDANASPSSPNESTQIRSVYARLEHRF